MVDMTLKPGGGKADKIITDALKAVARQDPSRVKKLAEKWWELAQEGDSRAYISLTERLEGKTPQPVVGGGEDEPPIKVDAKVEIVHVHAKVSE